MSLNDREKFIMHMVTTMTLSAMGDHIDIKQVQAEIRKGRCRRLTDKDVFIIWEDLREEVLNGKAVIEMKIDIRTCTRCGEIVYNSTDERQFKMYSDDGHGNNIVCASCEESK